VDDNCNGTVDEGVTVTCYVDADNDTYPPPGAVLAHRCPDSLRTLFGTCPAGYTATAPAAATTDCADMNPSVHPGAAEACNGVDDNCNGMVDEGLLHTYYRDADNDHFGDPLVSMTACTMPDGYVADNTDCADTDINAHPGQMDYFTTQRMVVGGYDYNCINGEEREATATQRCLAGLSGGCGAQAGQPGWYPTPGVPACGGRGTWIESCHVVSGPPYCAPLSSMLNKPQGCH
jgi:hypothetical protein